MTLTAAVLPTKTRGIRNVHVHATAELKDGHSQRHHACRSSTSMTNIVAMSWSTGFCDLPTYQHIRPTSFSSVIGGVVHKRQPPLGQLSTRSSLNARPVDENIAPEDSDACGPPRRRGQSYNARADWLAGYDEHHVELALLHRVLVVQEDHWDARRLYLHDCSPSFGKLPLEVLLLGARRLRLLQTPSHLRIGPVAYVH